MVKLHSGRLHLLPTFRVEPCIGSSLVGLHAGRLHLLLIFRVEFCLGIASVQKSHLFLLLLVPAVVLAGGIEP